MAPRQSSAPSEPRNRSPHIVRPAARARSLLLDTFNIASGDDKDSRSDCGNEGLGNVDKRRVPRALDGPKHPDVVHATQVPARASEGDDEVPHHLGSGYSRGGDAMEAHGYATAESGALLGRFRRRRGHPAQPTHVWHRPAILRVRGSAPRFDPQSVTDFDDGELDERPRRERSSVEDPATPVKKLKTIPRSAFRSIEKVGKYTFRQGVRIRDYSLPQTGAHPPWPSSRSYQCRDGFEGRETSPTWPRLPPR